MCLKVEKKILILFLILILFVSLPTGKKRFINKTVIVKVGLSLKIVS